MGRSTACEIVNDTAKQIVTDLLPKYVEAGLRKLLKVLSSFLDLHKLQMLLMVLTFQSFVHSTAQLIIATEKASTPLLYKAL